MSRQAARRRLDQLWARGRAFLGCELAIMGGAMTWVSERHLVSALSNAGGFGVIAGLHVAGAPVGGDRGHCRHDRSAVWRQPDHAAPAAAGADRRLPRP